MKARVCTHFVFWRYDHFPFVLGAPAFKDRDYWTIPSYQMWLPENKAQHVAGLKEGAERSLRLDLLRNKHREALTKIDIAFLEHAKATAPWLANVPPYAIKPLKRTAP